MIPSLGAVKWLPLHALTVGATEEEFWNALTIWRTKPHLVSKNVGGLKQVDLGRHEGYTYIGDLFNAIGGMNLESVKNYSDLKREILKNVEKVNCEDHKSTCEKTSTSNHIWLNLLCPKHATARKDIVLLVCFDYSENSAAFFKPIIDGTLPKLSADISYVVQLKENQLLLKTNTNVLTSDNDLKWLSSVLFPTLVRWIKAGVTCSMNSLSLVPADEYCFLYQHLKEKYWGNLWDIWTEATDPKKFIHEDIAIAAYLILIWKRETMKFVDLGCGNGLLVYILNSEDHSGFGIDVRPRKIWNKYPSSTLLKVGAITPSDHSLFPEVDWIIGNHSDELSPWIPVIAARSSYRCKFFLLPCCTYEFDGSKYARSSSSLSQYADYIEYLKKVADICGFKVKVDRLRIPSTKRICIIGDGRTYNKNKSHETEIKISEYINSRIPTNSHGVNERWIKTFVPRQSTERVRNCTQLNQTLVEGIINAVSNVLLEKKDSDSNTTWNEGKKTNLSDLVTVIPRTMLVQLKDECGGLKTLLRNHRHIFRVEEGAVRFRKPVPCINNHKSVNWKKKPCWFYKNHPDSCPLENDSCSFIH